MHNSAIPNVEETFSFRSFALLTIQIDRLIVGTFLSLADAGVYFRHVLLISMLYQVFNIAFHNRILPKVFSEARLGMTASLLTIVRREYLKVLVFWSISALALLLIFMQMGSYLITHYRLEFIYFILFLIMSAIRTRADLNALIFNALHFEGDILKLQMLSFATSLPFMVVLVILYSIPGLIVATGISALIYLTLTNLRLSRLRSEISND